MENIDPAAVIAAALANFIIGALWYSPLLFGRIWMRANGLGDDNPVPGAGPVTFAIAFVLCLAMAANLAAFVGGPEATVGFAVAASLAAGLGWAAFGLAVVALFERRSWRYIVVNGGYLTVSFAAMGLVIGLWP